MEMMGWLAGGEEGGDVCVSTANRNHNVGQWTRRVDVYLVVFKNQWEVRGTDVFYAMFLTWMREDWAEDGRWTRYKNARGAHR